MDGKIIDLMFCNIGDELKISIPNFYYKLDGSYLDKGYDKKDEKDWIHCPTFTGTYCGSRHDGETGELKIIKIRVSDPFKMSSAYYSYLEFSPTRIVSIEVLKKNSTRRVLDKISHTIVADNNFPKN